MSPQPNERLGILENRMDRVEEGIANFRSFQTDVREFITRADTRDDERKEHQTKRDQTQSTWFTALGLLVAILALLVGWLTYRDSQRKVSEFHNSAVSLNQSAKIPTLR